MSASLQTGYHFFFFLMIRRPPRSTLFPTRRSSDLFRHPRDSFETGRIQIHVASNAITVEQFRTLEKRSEEHTSELQSRLHLVCRLLLEKKKPSDYARRDRIERLRPPCASRPDPRVH